MDLGSLIAPRYFLKFGFWTETVSSFFERCFAEEQLGAYFYFRDSRPARQYEYSLFSLALLDKVSISSWCSLVDTPGSNQTPFRPGPTPMNIYSIHRPPELDDVETNYSTYIPMYEFELVSYDVDCTGLTVTYTRGLQIRPLCTARVSTTPKIYIPERRSYGIIQQNVIETYFLRFAISTNVCASCCNSCR